MPCLNENLLAAIARGAAPPAEVPGAEEHLARCTGCRTAVACLVQEETEAESPAPPLDFSTRIDRYMLRRVIGHGAMGVVYEAYDPQLDRRVCLKLLRPELSLEHRLSERLLREARALARLSHPNVVTVFDAGAHGDRVFLVMELVGGLTLRDWLAAVQRRRRWEEIVEVLEGAGAGLAAAHRAGVIHRDFKPSNVLVGDDGVVRVADFGLARATELPPPSDSPSHNIERHASEATLTLSEMAGTPAYMAPEQLRGARGDERSDQFSFSVTLYEALCGKRPDPASGDRLSFSGPSGQIPGRLQPLLRRGLSSDPSARFESMDALLAELRHTHRKTRRWVMAVGAAVALLGIVAWQWDARARLAKSCADDAPWLGVWDDATQKAARQAFAAAGANGTFEIVAATLDRYRESWTVELQSACSATYLARTQTEQVLALRRACLDRRRHAVASFATLLVKAGEIVGRAPDAAFALPSTEGCRTQDLLVEPMPQDPGAKARVEALRAELDELDVALNAGLLGEVGARAPKVVARARSTGFEPLVAEALLLQGRQLINAQDTSRAQEVLLEGVAIAEGARADVVAAKLWVKLLSIVGMNPDRAGLTEQLAKAAVQRLGSNPELERDLLSSLTALYLSQHNGERALELAEQNWRLAESTLTAPHPELADALNLLGVAFRLERRPQQARDALQRAVEMMRRAVGNEHVDLAEMLGNLGMAELDLEDPETAVGHFEECLRLLEKSVAPDSPRLCDALEGLAHGLSRLQRPGAMEMIQRSLHIREALFGTEAPEVALTLDNLAVIATRQGDLLRARDALRRSLPIFKASLPPSALARPLAHLCRLAEDPALRREAVGACEQIVSSPPQIVADDSPARAIAWEQLAAVALDQGRSADAIALFSRALTAEEQRSPDSTVTAELRLAHAIAQAVGGQLPGALEALEKGAAAPPDARTPQLRAKYEFALAQALRQRRQPNPRALALDQEARRALSDPRAQRWLQRTQRAFAAAQR
jgi:tetratricopeptide (TPR) repeat protein